jgi:hypothetical protein
MDRLSADDWFHESIWRRLFRRVSSAGKVLHRHQAVFMFRLHYLSNSPRCLTLGCNPWFRNPLSKSIACDYEPKPNSCDVSFKISPRWFPSCSVWNRSTGSQCLLRCFNIRLSSTKLPAKCAAFTAHFITPIISLKYYNLYSSLLIPPLSCHLIVSEQSVTC